ncbi:MAG: Nucleoside-triphosphatase THEP1 [Chloroflexi bacterium]|nr:Nucleoside-triphosphatase THEP1 [Chloroflexota bacterium]
MKRIYLLTGMPGTGKTTIIKEVLSGSEKSAGGFYTEEIRTQGMRQGFQIVTLDGETTTLAHIHIHSPYRVSKYGVDLSELERVGVPAIERAIRSHDIVVIDEIGKMELFSSAFRIAALEAIESGKLVLGTIMLKPHPWADKIKRHPAVELILVDRSNRQEILRQLLQWIRFYQEK